jgi:hypothetical protein
MKIGYPTITMLIAAWCVPFRAYSKVTTSTAEDQKSLQVTVYNSNLGLIKDVRTITLPKGEGELRFMDVAAHIMPQTVRAKSINRSSDFAVLEQNYEYDLMSADKLLDKYVGKKVKIIDINEFKGKKDEIEAILLSNNSGQIFKINDEIYLGHPGLKVLPAIPENLIANPTLMWLYANKRKNAYELEVSYLTNNLSWKADYVLALNNDDTKSDLSGWVTIDNQSGAAYKNAKLTLVAGEVHRAPQPSFDRRLRAKRTYVEKAMAAPGFKEKEFFEYHIYNLQRKTTIKHNQTKQINLLDASAFAITKELLTKGQSWYYARHYRSDDTKQPVEVYVKFKNSRQNNLGMPLPAGIMRVYKRDSEGSQQFVGEDNIEHTPNNEEIKLKLGKAFDVVAERTQTDYKEIGSRAYETAWEIVLRNHKKTSVTIGIIEPLQGDWKVVSRSHDFRKLDAFTIRFDIAVPRDGEKKITYRVRVER